MPAAGGALAVALSGHHYSLGAVDLALELAFLAGVSLRAISKIFAILAGLQVGIVQAPHWSTVRLWLLRLGYYKLTRPKTKADDWIYLVDHSCQIGPHKGLLILGVRLCDLPPVGECLRLQDLEPIELIPVAKSDKQVVLAQLESATQKTGVPRAILRDEGGDLAAGTTLFCAKHPQTAQIYDIKHKTACLLKRWLRGDGRWQAFCSRTGQARVQTLQTELAFLRPPAGRPKARYMNVHEFVAWGRRTLAVVDQPSAAVLANCTVDRLEAKFGWLREYRAALAEWADLMAVVEQAQSFVRQRGHFAGAAEALAKELDLLAVGESAQQLGKELVAFVAEQSAQARPKERLPGSTEILESCFGKFKRLEGEQSRDGLTGLMLALAAMVSHGGATVVQKALAKVRTQSVLDWCRQKLGVTVQSQRRLAYAKPSGAQPKPDQPQPAPT